MIVVGTTVVAWKCNGNETAWLDTAELMIRDAKEAGHDLTFFVAYEYDARGEQPFENLADRVAELDAESAGWAFRIWDGSEIIDGSNRLFRICAGRNFVQDYAVANGASHILFLDTDTRPPGDCISKLLELDWPMVGGNVGSYCLSGPVVEEHPLTAQPYDFPVQKHWNTAGFLLVGRDVFRYVKWRVDPDAGMSDDPCYDYDAMLRGWPTLVRKDVNGEHVEALIPVEQRPEELRRIVNDP